MTARPSRTLGTAVLVLVMVAGLAACGGGAPPNTFRTPDGTVAAAASGAAPTASPAGGDVTLAFAGDVHFAGRTATLLDGDPTTAFGPVADVLAAADVAMVNLETAVTTRGAAEPKQFHFRAPPTAFEAVRGAGVDVVTIANNHALDFGQVGLADTLDAARAAGIPVVGAGSDAAAAYAPWTTEVRGVRIAIVAVSQVHELESRWAARDDRPGIAMAGDGGRVAASVRQARQHADVVVVYAHWGREGSGCPTGEQADFARTMAEAGADVVVGTHAHLLLGTGWSGRTYVAYGLGNFVWWRDDAYSNDTGVLRVRIHDGSVAGAEFVPAVISRTSGQPLPVTGPDATRIRAELDRLRQCAGLAQARR